ncbi:hypothetical protein SDC9_192651 [bioreactor metagenome]|uniref:HTH-type transcriptional repressor PurR n=1 Tax=bioreactor metagenome TaxID=1076179 RepID=A0A645I9U2_9ZZZZ
MLRAGIRPGVDAGVLSLAIAGSELPGGLDWSTVEFSTYHLGRRCAESILSVLCRTGEANLSFRLLPRINPGRTLQLRRTPPLSCQEK